MNCNKILYTSIDIYHEEKFDKSLKHLESVIVYALSSIAQTTPNFCNHESNILNWFFPLFKRLFFFKTCIPFDDSRNRDFN